MPLILALRRLKQQDLLGFEVNLGYIVRSRLQGKTLSERDLGRGRGRGRMRRREKRRRRS